MYEIFGTFDLLVIKSACEDKIEFNPNCGFVDYLSEIIAKINIALEGK